MRYEERSLGGKSKGVAGLGHSLPATNHYRMGSLPQNGSAPVRLEIQTDMDSPEYTDGRAMGPASAAPTLANWGRLRESMPPAMGANGEAYDYVQMRNQQSNDMPKCVSGMRWVSH
jgi:hypothetical protein